MPNTLVFNKNNNNVDIKLDNKDKGNIKKKSSQLPTWVREFLAELVGTFLLVMIGDCGIANYLLNRDSKVGIDQFGVAFTFGIGGMLGIIVSGPISGAHINPAVSLAMATIGKLPFWKVPHYFAGQYIGAFLAACYVYGSYFEAIQTYDQGHRVPWFSPELYNASFVSFATGGIFSTYPAVWMTSYGALIDQLLATFTFVFGICIITNPKNKLPYHLQPLLIGLTLCAMIISFGLNCGAILNPARDISPRLFQLIGGYGINSFTSVQSLYWLTAGIIGPHLGAIIAVWLYKFLIHYDEENEEENIYIVDPGDDVEANKEEEEQNQNPSEMPFLVSNSKSN